MSKLSCVGLGQEMLIAIRDVPQLRCDFCYEILCEPPDGSIIRKVKDRVSLHGGMTLYEIVPSINTPEWLAEAQERDKWICVRLFGRLFTVCIKCQGKGFEIPEPSVSSNASPTANPDAPEAKK